MNSLSTSTPTSTSSSGPGWAAIGAGTHLRPCRAPGAGWRRWVGALLCLAGAAQAQQFQVQPGATLLVGDDLQIEMTDLPPHSEVDLRASRVLNESGSKRLYVAQARFKASADGRINLATQAPLAGSYAGADALGLFWSMQPVQSGAVPDDWPSARVVLTATVLGAAKDQPAIEQTLQLLRASPSVQSRPVAAFEGAVFAYLPAAPSPGKRPALILLGGSEGGSSVTQSAPLWASRGFAVLALPYYSPPQWSASGPAPAELPTLPPAFADIPIDRLEQARDWLAQQPEADAARIGVMGTSKGAEFALLAGAKMPWIKSIVAVVPSDVVWEGWGPGVEAGQRAGFSWRGQAFDFVPYKDFAQEMAGFATGNDVKIRRPQDQGRAAHPDRAIAARIRVEDIAAPVMLIGGDDDQVWDSGGMAKNILKVRQQAGRETLALIYPDAGHYLGGTGLGPTTQYNASPMKSGGTPVANARAQAEAFKQTTAFLRRTLGPMPK